MLMLSSGIYMSLLSPSQDQDAADLLDLCPPWSQVKPKYAAIKARLDQLEKLYEHYDQEMDEWDQPGPPAGPLWRIEKEIKKIDDMKRLATDFNHEVMQ
ncbi:unnamed protein product [Durusdinium trenchii]|uniref:Uncharacterized protein n=1 Tax=Durusdinium trenchii TaxID=1381693 RepID=A0ABP0JC03_9DINO